MNNPSNNYSEAARYVLQQVEAGHFHSNFVIDEEGNDPIEVEDESAYLERLEKIPPVDLLFKDVQDETPAIIMYYLKQQLSDDQRETMIKLWYNPLLSCKMRHCIDKKMTSLDYPFDLEEFCCWLDIQRVLMQSDEEID